VLGWTYTEVPEAIRRVRGAFDFRRGVVGKATVKIVKRSSSIKVRSGKGSEAASSKDS